MSGQKTNKAVTQLIVLALAAVLSGCVPKPTQDPALSRVAGVELSPGVKVCLKMEDTAIPMGTNINAKVIIVNDSPRKIIVRRPRVYGFTLKPLLSIPEDSRTRTKRAPASRTLAIWHHSEYESIRPGSSWVIAKNIMRTDDLPRGLCEYVFNIGGNGEWEIFEEGNRDDPLYEGNVELTAEVTIE